ncbi:MAG: MBL fold metallo-hydrolase [Aggregatilineales bacterium]
MEIKAPFYQAKIMLTEEIPLHVFLVKGADYAVWIDSGIKSMFDDLVQTMHAAGVADSDLKFILNTHSHHDHIGCNASMKNKTGCLIAAPAHYARWHSSFEAHYQEFARPFPEIFPDTPELRAEVLDPLDAEHKIDFYIDEGAKFDLGGGVTLTAYSFPGHMLAELGWFEESTRTLIVSDAITGLDWALIHGHLSVAAYRHTIEKIDSLLGELNVQQVLMAHFPAMTPDSMRNLTRKARAYLDGIERTLIKIVALNESTTLEDLWREFLNRYEKLTEFRSLSTVAAHVDDLVERRIFKRVDTSKIALI